jgi:hypothetical protein
MMSAAYGAEISSGMATSLSKGASAAGADFNRLSQHSLLKARLTPEAPGDSRAGESWEALTNSGHYVGPTYTKLLSHCDK